MKKYKIILVENDEDEQLFMKKGFDDAGLFEVLAQVENGDELFSFLSAYKNNLPDLVLTDLNMPGKNGYDIIREIRNTPSYSHIPVIVTSTSNTKAFIDKCMEFGAAAYVIKPETFNEYEPFAKNLHGLIEEKQLVKQLS